MHTGISYSEATHRSESHMEKNETSNYFHKGSDVCKHRQPI